MQSSPSVRVGLVVGTAVPATGVSVAFLLRGWSTLGSALSAPVPGPAIVALAQVVASGCACWLLLTTVLTVLGELPWSGRGLTRRLAHNCTPAYWRTSVLAVVGMGVGVGVLGTPALAAAPLPHDVASDHPGGHHPAALDAADSDTVSGLDALDGLVLPDRPSGAWQHGSDQQAVVVRSGDSLWSITARSLPPPADVAAVARACARWYDANAAVIGPDPDLLLPGTRLRAPGSRAPHSLPPHR